MAITNPHSVLILGAGVSAPFGLSLGGDMISVISNAIKNEIQTIYSRNSYGDNLLGQNLRSAATTTLGFSEFPIHGAMARMVWNGKPSLFADEKIKRELDKIKKLGSLLDGQTSETIDDFIVENPSYADLTKICIASMFIQSCYNFGPAGAGVKPFSDRHFQPSPEISYRNWVHLLINIIRQGIRSETVSSTNKVKIVTFNYDKILEHILEKQFSNTEASYDHYTNFIEIMHVHGECGELENILDQNVTETCLQWAEGIHVVSEDNVPKDVIRNRASAKNAIQSANELFFCGFSFSGPNCRLLGLDSLNTSRSSFLLSYCNYDGNVGVSKTVKKLEKRRVVIEEAAGSIERPLGVTDWLMQGHLGELPG